MRVFRVFVCLLSLVVAACSSDSDSDSGSGTGFESESESESLTTEPTGAQGDLMPMEMSDGNEDPVFLNPAFNVNESAFELIRDMAAYKPDQIAGVVPDFAQIIISTAIGSSEILTNGEFVTTDSRFDTVVTQTDRMLYQCSGGGTMEHETGMLRLIDISYSHNRDINTYRFDQCRFYVTSDRAIIGNYSANGVLYTGDGTRSGSSFGEGVGEVQWTEFELVGPDSLRYEVEGSSRWNSTSSIGNSFRSRQAEFKYYRKTQGIEVINEMTDSRFQMNVNFDGGNSQNTLDMQFSGSFEDNRGAGRVITINTVNAFLLSAGLGEEQLTPEGQVSVESSDGGSMSLFSSGSDDRLDPAKNLLVDWTSISADGSAESKFGVSLGSYTVAIDLCNLSSAEVPLICADGSYAYSLP